MIRLFRQHQRRDVESLDGTWTYAFPRQGTAIAPGEAGEEVPLEVPGAWEADLLARVNYRGEAVARRSFTMPAAGPAVLAFAGVSHTARVLVDGRELGGHHDSHTAFALEIPHLAAGAHEVAVHISNAFGALSGLHIPNDYYTYGGITRPVELHRPAGPAFIRRADATVARDGAGWRVAVTARLANLGPAAVRHLLRARLADAHAEVAVDIPPGGGEAVLELRPSADAAVWTPEAPALHRLELDLGGIDDWCDRIGLRTLAWDAQGLRVNGRARRLLGVCRHEDHGEYGCALTVAAMRRDLELIRLLGANAVRTTHYPNDQRFLDLCDEAGLLVWEENHARGQRLDGMRHPRFRAQALRVTEEMVEQHRNHPSIVVWGLLNECASDQAEGRVQYAEQCAAIRARDASRPVSYASDRHQGDLCLELCDIPSWNIYPLWYRDDVSPGAMLDEVIAAHAAPLAGRALMVSEIGAGGIPGLHDPVRRAKWSEERQADILAAQLAGVLAHPRVCGVFIWQFCDCRVTEEGWALSRPGCINDKGVVDRWRRPKLAFAAAQAAFRAAAMPPA